MFLIGLICTTSDRVGHLKQEPRALVNSIETGAKLLKVIVKKNLD